MMDINSQPLTHCSLFRNWLYKTNLKVQHYVCLQIKYIYSFINTYEITHFIADIQYVSNWFCSIFWNKMIYMSHIL